MAMRPQPPLSRERPCCMPAAAASAAPTQPSDAEIARLDREARLRDRERDYEQRMEAMLQLRAKAAEGGGSGGGSRVGPHTLVSNPFLDLTEAQADRVFEMIEEIHHTGYAIYEGLCSPEEVAALNAGLPWDGVPRLSERLGDSRAGADEVMEPGDWKLGHDTKYGGRQTKHIHNVFAKTRAADAVACKPELLAVVAGVVGQHFQLSTTVISNPLPGSDPQGVHQDDGMFPLPRPHMPMLCNSLLALDDITVANGGTWIAKGSMTWEAGRRPLPEEISYLEMPAGSVACWDGGLFHAGGGNRTESDNRRILNCELPSLSLAVTSCWPC